MPDSFSLLSQYFWLAALGFAAFNYRSANKANAKSVAPEKLPEARAYLRKFALAAALPWVLMGVGQTTGLTPTIWHYFRPQDGNIFVLAWLATIFLLSCVFAWWVLMADGVARTIEFNLLAAIGQQGSKPPSPRMIKFIAVLGVAMFPVWVYLASSANTPLPR